MTPPIPTPIVQHLLRTVPEVRAIVEAQRTAPVTLQWVAGLIAAAVTQVEREKRL